MESNYDKKAQNFLTRTNTTIDIRFLKHDKYFSDDTQSRDIYEFTITRNDRQFTALFGQSIVNSGFYYTMGKQKIDIPRSFLGATDIVNYCKRDSYYQFLNNGKSDIIHYPKEPTPYDILACLTKYNPGSFSAFCDEYGYDIDSMKAHKIYADIVQEWLNVNYIWDDSEIEELRDIS